MSQGHRRIAMACGQIVCAAGDIDHNLEQIGMLAGRVADQGARLMLCGEGAITGYLLAPHVLSLAPRPEDPPVKRLLAISARHDLAIVAGSLSTSDRGHHVTAFVAFPDGRLLVQHKHMLTPKERAAGIVPGEEERLIFEVDGIKCAVCICADGGIPDIYNKLARRGCQVYVAPTAGGAGREFMCTEAMLDTLDGMRTYRSSMEKVCFMGHALEQCRKHRMALLACNLAGDDGESNYHPGHSSIVDSRGCSVGLIPGEYVAEWLRPQTICGDIVVQEPRTA